jgi:D-aminopeptidase
MAQDGIAMAVQPSHTPLDGDTIFAISTGHESCDNPAILSELGSAAARCVARSLMRAVYEASK